MTHRDRVAPFLVIVIAAGAAAAQAGMTDKPARPAPGPVFSQSVLEMTPETLARFGRALGAEDTARRATAARAAAPQSKARLTKEQYEQCQMNAAMNPEFARRMTELSAAVSSAAGPEAQRKAAESMQTGMQAYMEKQCGPDPSAEAERVDVAGELRRAQEKAAGDNGFTPRQYAILKERISPLCLSEPTAPGPNGIQVPGQGNVSYVYTSAEVAAVRPRCEAFLRSLYPERR
jgi:hypothetical protein